MKLKKIALLAMSALALAACGGGGGSAPVIDAAPHIKGTVVGSMFNATAEVGGDWSAAGAMAELWASLPGAPPEGSNHTSHWGINNLTATVGTYQCSVENEQGLRLDLHDTLNDFWYESYGGATGTCSVTVKAVSETEISGTFEATLVRDNDASMTVNVSDGTFRVPRTSSGGPR